MKKEEQTWVDDHFRQRETDIPVTFDPKHWEQLAAALDHATQPGMPPHPSTPKSRKPFGGNKGWWVSGVCVLALLSSAWVLWQRTQVAPPIVPETPDSALEKSQPVAPVAPPPLPPVPSVSGAAEKAATAQTENSTGGPTPETPAEDSEHRTPGSKNEILTAADSLLLKPTTPVNSPLDTTSMEKRKRKHLFW